MIKIDNEFRNIVEVDGFEIPCQLLEDPVVKDGILVVRAYYDKRKPSSVVYECEDVKYQIKPCTFEKFDEDGLVVVTFYLNASKLEGEIKPYEY